MYQSMPHNQTVGPFWGEKKILITTRIHPLIIELSCWKTRELDLIQINLKKKRNSWRHTNQLLLWLVPVPSTHQFWQVFGMRFQWIEGSELWWIWLMDYRSHRYRRWAFFCCIFPSIPQSIGWIHRRGAPVARSISHPHFPTSMSLPTLLNYLNQWSVLIN